MCCTPSRIKAHDFPEQRACICIATGRQISGHFRLRVDSADEATHQFENDFSSMTSELLLCSADSQRMRGRRLR